MSRSHRANRYGTLFERRAAEKYSLELERASWKDARRADGTPVEIKCTMVEHADGQPGTIGFSGAMMGCTFSASTSPGAGESALSSRRPSTPRNSPCWSGTAAATIGARGRRK